MADYFFSHLQTWISEHGGVCSQKNKAEPYAPGHGSILIDLCFCDSHCGQLACQASVTMMPHGPWYDSVDRVEFCPLPCTPSSTPYSVATVTQQLPKRVLCPYPIHQLKIAGLPKKNPCQARGLDGCEMDKTHFGHAVRAIKQDDPGLSSTAYSML